MTLPASPHPLTEALGHAASDKRLEVLRRVGQTGSISQAARDAGISYKAAWQAIETLSNLSGLPLVDRSVGGNGGGGARITEHGRHLLALADELAQARAQVLARFGHARPDGLAARSGLGLRTSMRNQLPCVVVGVQALGQGPMVQVVLQTHGQQVMTSLVTRDSADLLGLAPDLAVLALCKATAVQVNVSSADALQGLPVQGLQTWAQFAVNANDTGSLVAGCSLSGEVADVSSGPGPHEVALTLPGGGLWVGFAAKGVLPRVGDAACGVFAPSAVVIGLAG